MLRRFKSLGIRSQIIIFLALVLSFVMGLITLANRIQKQVFHYNTSTTSTSIIFYSNLKQIGQISSQISYYLKSRHQRSQFLIEHLAQFIYFLSTQEQKFQTKYQLDLCVTKDEFKQKEYLKNTPKFCYQIHEKDDLQVLYSENKYRKFLINGLSLLDHFGLIFNIYDPNMLQVVDFSNFTFDSSYPFGLVIKDYDPKSQQWYHNKQFRYINHVKKINNQVWQQNFFSDVYQVLSNNISQSFSITQSLINKDKQIFGIFNTQLRITDDDLFNIGHNVLLLNKNGQIIYNGLDQRKNISEIFYIYNQSITGLIIQIGIQQKKKL